VTSDERDSASRLSDALDDLFERRTDRPQDDTDRPGLVAHDDIAPPLEPRLAQREPSELATAQSTLAASDATGGPYVLPPIVLATEPPPNTNEVDAATDISAVPSRNEPAPAVPRAVPATAPTSPAGGALPTSWGDNMPVVTAPAAGELRAAGRRPRVRRVTRVIRHVDPWSVFKVGLIFSLVMYVVVLSSGVLLWRVAESTGSLDNVERWFTQFGWETFDFKGGELFRNAWIIGLFGVVAMTGALVLMATLFNLVSDIVGGVRVTVLEEEVIERTMSNARRYVVRRPVDTGRAGASVSNWSVDDNEPIGTVETQPTVVSATGPKPTSDWSADD